MAACSQCGGPVGTDGTYCRECRTAADRSDDAGTASTGEDGTELPHDRYSREVFALRYPLAKGPRVVVVNTVLLAGSVFVVPLLALWGYAYRVGRAAALGRSHPPGYGDPRGLVGDGARLLVVGTPFVVVAAASVRVKPSLVPVGLGPLAGRAGAWMPGHVAGGLGSPGVTVVLDVVLWAIPMAAVVVYLGTGRVTDARFRSRLRSLLGSKLYWKGTLGFGWLVLILVLLVGFGLVGAMLAGGIVWVAVARSGLALPAQLATVADSVPAGIGPVAVVIATACAVGLASLLPATGAYCGYLYHEAAGKGVVPPATGTVTDGRSE
ncbi:MAG: DUF4013 domain-containing protein [Halobellus sp.]|uniref:DUF4013 domain-containing protein n=1 Tax=Halobellus sp. TaxID=1979212 RepID=UPI0035D4E318